MEKTRNELDVSLKTLSSHFEWLAHFDAKNGSVNVLFGPGTENEMITYDLFLDALSIKDDKNRQALALSAISEYLDADKKFEYVYETNASRLKKIDFHTEADQVVIMVEDITDLNNQLKADMMESLGMREEAKFSTVAAARFLSLLSRDMRTPIHTILGVLDLADDDSLSSQISDYFSKIQLAGFSLSETIDDLVQLCNVLENRLNITPGTVVLNDTLNIVTRAITPRIEYSKVTFTTDTTGLTSQAVITDTYFLNQVLIKTINFMVHNAVAGSKICMRVSEALQRYDKTQILFNIESTEFKIPFEEMKALFVPYQLEGGNIEESLQDIEKDINSLNINIVVVKSLVARLGGVIHIEKFGLNGIRLVLDFNFTRVEQEFTPKQEPIQIEKVVEFGYPDFRGKRALLADDDPISRAVGVRLLDKTGIETTEVSDGFEAVEAYLASDGDYDVILMDIRMPELNGLKATRKIRESHLSNSETIPIIAITVNAFEKDMQQSFSAGMNAHLVKPIDKQSLYEILEKYLLTENDQ